ncbi:MAG: hypothetical protein ACOYJ8_01645, partial [Patescibacteria group bacterium]
FVFFLLAGLLALITSFNLFKKRSTLLALGYFFVSLGLFFVSFEEISWGQRILEIETPSTIAEKNVQNELTIHNLYQFQIRLTQIYIIIGLWGTFGFLITKKLKKFLPWKWIKDLSPPKTLSLYFFLTFAYYFWVEYLDEPVARTIRDLILPQKDFPGKTTLSWLQFWFKKDLNFLDAYIDARDQEPVEFILSLGTLLFVFNNFLKHLPQKALAKPLKVLAAKKT